MVACTCPEIPLLSHRRHESKVTRLILALTWDLTRAWEGIPDYFPHNLAISKKSLSHEF